MEAPSLDCPMNIIVESDPGVCSANVSFSDMVNATDNCEQSLNITCNPMSGSTFNTSVRGIVTCVTEDESGNDASCNFSVTVIGNSLFSDNLKAKKSDRTLFIIFWLY